jgi:hypothetical protein
MSFISHQLNLCKGMPRKRARQCTIFHTDFLSDCLILWTAVFVVVKTELFYR